MHYRELERNRISALKRHYGDYEAEMLISESMKCELKWWFTNVHTQYRHIDKGNPEICVITDASLLGWGAVCQNSKIGGRCTENERQKHINELELMAILFALKSFRMLITNKHVKFLTENTTAVFYITNMGGIQSITCDKISRDIWAFCIENNIWVSCSHIAGKENDGDIPSRQFNDRTEWSLSAECFETICSVFGTPYIDLFASRLNTKLDVYCAWKPDPGASYIDAVTLNWSDFQFCYIFPPFSLLPACIRKIKQDKARALVIAPVWPTQTWFSILMKILIQEPRILPRKKNLQLQHQEIEHPLQKKLVLMTCSVSGVLTENRDFQEQLQELSCRHGEIQQNANSSAIFRDGFSTVIDSKYLSFLFL